VRRWRRRWSAGTDLEFVEIPVDDGHPPSATSQAPMPGLAKQTYTTHTLRGGRAVNLWPRQVPPEVLMPPAAAAAAVRPQESQDMSARSSGPVASDTTAQHQLATLQREVVQLRAAQAYADEANGAIFPACALSAQFAARHTLIDTSNVRCGDASNSAARRRPHHPCRRQT
jgi:hypothetical protein